MALLEVHGLVKRFGRRTVVDGVSFEVHEGEVVGLLGPNGAGKTTSFRMATGQITPNAGAVYFRFGLNKPKWRFASLPDLRNIVVAAIQNPMRESMRLLASFITTSSRTTCCSQCFRSGSRGSHDEPLPQNLRAGRRVRWTGTGG